MCQGGTRKISIHALRKESDRPGLSPAPSETISIHALRKESDLSAIGNVSGLLVFQSTLSVRRATFVNVGRQVNPLISIHALRKESDPEKRQTDVRRHISIHALRKESDRAAGHFCPLSETQASCLALSISNNTTGTTNNMPKTSSCLSVSF